MYIIVNSDKTIKEVQKEFNDKFPFLKLEFVSNNNLRRSLEGTSFNNNVDKGNLIITDETIVSKMVEEFERNYGLHAHVLRRSGNIWLETTVTNDWTLSMQNTQGEIISKSLDRK